MKQYDFIIVGGGVAGLSLAYHLSQSPLRDSSILIIDKRAKTKNDRTLSFWANRPTLFDEIVYRSWNRLEFIGDDERQTIDLGDYRYHTIRGFDLYEFVRTKLSACNVEFMTGTAQHIEDGEKQATVSVNGQTYTGRWIFDSRLQPGNSPGGYSYLKVHFKGWEIETPAPAFDSQVAMLMDFRTPQQQDTRFFYVLPYSSNRALVEYTLFSAGHLSRIKAEQTLRSYIENTLGLKEYQIVAEEGGSIPATDRPFPRQVGRRVMTIGAAGGQVKPSTSYAFWRIQQDSAAIVRSLSQKGHPFDVPTSSPLYRLCDSLLLRVMARHGARIKSIFTALFKNNPVQRIFRFLDEQTSLVEILSLMASLPSPLFIQALLQPPGAIQMPPLRPKPTIPRPGLKLTSDQQL